MLHITVICRVLTCFLCCVFSIIFTYLVFIFDCFGWTRSSSSIAGACLPFPGQCCSEPWGVLFLNPSNYPTDAFDGYLTTGTSLAMQEYEGTGVSFNVKHNSGSVISDSKISCSVEDCCRSCSISSLISCMSGWRAEQYRSLFLILGSSLKSCKEHWRGSPTAMGLTLSSPLFRLCTELIDIPKFMTTGISWSRQTDNSFHRCCQVIMKSHPFYLHFSGNLATQTDYHSCLTYFSLQSN